VCVGAATQFRGRVEINTGGHYGGPMTIVPLVIEPDPDDPDCATVMVDAEIAGRPYRFVLDTGAARTSVMADDYLATLAVHSQQDSTGVFSSRSEDVVMLPSVSLGPVTVTDLLVVRGPAQPDRHHLLGMDALGGIALRFDFSRRELEMVPSGTLPTAFPLDRSPRGHPFVDVVWPDVTARACWDSGASITVVDTGFRAAHADLFAPAGTSEGADSTGVVMQADMYVMAAATVGNLVIAAHRVAAVDLPQDACRMDIVLGYPALAQGVWTIDYRARRWAATPVTK
jgi:gag-polyprotein putative aspartyl protease